MKVYLVKPTKVVFWRCWKETDSNRRVYYRSANVPADPTATTRGSTALVSEKKKWAVVKELLEYSTEPQKYPRGTSQHCFWFVDVSIGVEKDGMEGAGSLKGCLKLQGVFPTKSWNGLSRIAELFPGAQVAAEVRLFNPGKNNEKDQTLFTFSTEGMTLRKCQDGDMVFEDVNLKCPVELYGLWRSPRKSPPCAVITVTVTIPDYMLSTHLQGTSLELFLQDSWKLPSQKIWKDAVLYDLTIVCRDGWRFGAHRSFLASRSSVFMAMFQTEMKESRKNVLELRDMDRKNVRAFMKYLYFDDIQTAEEDFRVALELFKAGNKYDVGCLERKMKDLICRKSNDWFDIYDAVELFLFARTLTPAEDCLKMKATRVLERYRNELTKSPAMVKLSQTDPQAVLELLQLAFTRKDVVCKRCEGAEEEAWKIPTRRMLEAEVFTDVTILCKDGTEIKAHRSFLAAQSLVFLAMFQGGRKKPVGATVEISDMATNAVRSLLKVLYYNDIQDPEKDFMMAFALLKAGVKYEIFCLKEKMKELILKKSKKDIGVDGAVQLLAFAESLTPVDVELMFKAKGVLVVREPLTLKQTPPPPVEIIRNTRRQIKCQIL